MTASHTFQHLLIEDRDAVRVVTINRPDKLNALNFEVLTELRDAFAAIAADPAVRAVVLRGAGEKAFVAGADIAELVALSPIQARDFSQHGQRMMRSIELLGKPVVAMIRGYALGGGLELAMSCHLRIAADNAKVGQPEINLGVLPGFGGTQRLLRLAGRGATLELCLTGTPIGAQRAYELGIVNRIVPAEHLEEATFALAAQLAAAAPQALRGILDAVQIGGECGIDAGLDYETQAFAVCTSTNDMREGTRAFLERRKPVFTGA
ncbi:MAG: enoyl-CoA hydratase/isomerase family protein [Proteobacteria bacterium]|nr:enoyl-CoA hydratase/isomerase family protein [Pseudomonadota bacterium]